VLVPIADVPAQFFSMLAIGIALYLPMTEHSPHNVVSVTPRIGQRLLQSPAWCGALAGISLGFAYWIRHTQILLAAPMVLAVLLRGRSMSRQAQRMWLVALCIGAGLTALPDLFYHQQVFGGFLTFESEELQTFSPDVTGLAFKRLWDDFALGHEFGFILPLTVLGAIQMARARIRAFAVMLAWVVVPLAFHLFYPALRLRDLLPETPPLVLWTAWGAADLLGADWQPNAPQAITRRPIVRRLLAVAGIVFALVSLSFRTQTTVARSLTPHRAGFGYLSAEERTVFDSIGQLTPQDSVIMASLHSGAIDLYAHRLTIRSQVWTGPQLDVFLAEMNREGRAVYFLYDSPSLRDHLYWLMQGGRLERVAAFGNLTFFGEREAESSTLYRVVPARAPAP
ncbi:MAG: hypothetical protein HYR71_12635, partial [Chloroflexi bacterium]|nr:hypothetical protein [Chloroflexota bacterium]